MGSLGSVASLSEALNRPVHWLPGANDTIRFSPYPDPPARAIDVYSIGRRWKGIHQALIQASERKEIFYIYDTFGCSNVETYDHKQHH